MYMDDRELSYIKVMTADEGGNIYQSSVLPEPGDLFRPLHSTHSPDGEVTEETGEPIVWAEDIRLVRTWPPEGRHIRILCMAESLAGEGADFYSDPIAVRWTAGGEDSEEENESSVRDRVGGVWSYFVNQH